jgi:hypothetical protein
MLQFMGRENLDDYNADFLVMLQTWEGRRKRGQPDRRGFLAAYDL